MSEFLITRRAQHFRVTKFSPTAERAIKAFSRDLIHWGLTKIYGKFVREPQKVFAASTKDRSEYRFHINAFDGFIDHMATAGFQEGSYTIRNERPSKGVDVVYDVKASWVPRPPQEPAIEYVIEENSESNIRFLGLQTGFGKSQPVDSYILTPKGNRRLADVKVGEVVVKPSGGVSTIKSIHPQGDSHCFRLVFDDGRTVECSRDHNWRVHSSQDPDRWMLLSTEQVVENTQTFQSDFTWFPLSTYDTYQGDGWLDDAYELGSQVGLIPNGYEHLHIDARIEFVRGFLDSVDVRFEAGRIIIPTYCEEISQGLQRMLWSFGAWCAINHDTYNEVILKTDYPTYFFRETVVPPDFITQTPYLSIAEVYDIGHLETVCVKLSDEDELYLTDDFVVTHNTFISIYSVAKLGKRAVYLMRPMYMDKWFMDFEKTYTNAGEDTILVRGKDQLIALMNKGLADKLDVSNIVISNKTYQAYLNKYEELGAKGIKKEFPVAPDDFWKTIGCGIVVMDEVHLDFHLNFKLNLYMNVGLQISMTATLISDDAFIMRMHELAYPSDERFNGGEYNRYVHASSYEYQFRDAATIRTTEHGDTRYSHHVFERWVMGNKERKERYYELLNNILKLDYFDIRDPGESVLLFFSSKVMCTDFTMWLRQRYPNETVGRYIDGDDYINDFITPTIVVSTIGKSGAAVDKPMLRTAIRTIALRSSSSNYQALGRTRELKSGNTPRFTYLVCLDVPKQIEYHEHMVGILKETALNYRNRRHFEPI